MNWAGLAMKLPGVILGAMHIAEQVAAAKGPEKKAAVMEALPDSVHLIEFAAGKDVLNDAAVKELVSAVIDAEASAMKARAALQAGILAKAS